MCSVTQLCPTLCDTMNCSMPGSSVHGIVPARILEWVAISSSIVRIYVGYYFVWPSQKREERSHSLFWCKTDISYSNSPQVLLSTKHGAPKPLSPLFDSSTVVSLTLVHDDIFIPVKLILIRYILLLYLSKYSRILLSNICSVSTLLCLQLWWAERLLDQDLNHWPKVEE